MSQVADLLESFGLDPEETIDCSATFGKDRFGCESDDRCQWSLRDDRCEWTMERKVRVMVRLCRNVSEWPDEMRRGILVDVDRTLPMSPELRQMIADIPADDSEQWRIACYEIMRSLILPAFRIEPGTPQADELLTLVDRAENLHGQGKKSPKSIRALTLHEEWRAVPKWPKVLGATAAAVPLLYADMFALAALVVLTAFAGDSPHTTGAQIAAFAGTGLTGIFLANVLGLGLAYQAGGAVYLATSRLGRWIKSFFA